MLPFSIYIPGKTVISVTIWFYKSIWATFLSFRPSGKIFRGHDAVMNYEHLSLFQCFSKTTTYLVTVWED